ncbi:DUF1850 domain-containing protein [Noviherbaspirillum galbum]|uniref:DUF1850 domain-containing protein n=1 Tax=Noviherbaspirillum galbum TaxID=2709383 RepID=A0A6B3SP42_9BURK|nr:DUF1850 domain-containing protein [Noviherbaspirillum galbum]NEX60476.1 DUF1850 domain-containing protein [Noviherbaspirillum galbum]
MTALCLAAAALSVVVPVQAFTLAWTHSIEKIRWEEDYRVVGGRLQLEEARIRGSGAGMEPPDDAVFRQGAWHYRPAVSSFASIDLARSGYVADYQLCWDGRCHSMSEFAGSVEQAPVVTLSSCP